MDGSSAPDLFLAAPPEAPGARHLLADWARRRATERGARVLLAGAGLGWARDDDLRPVIERADVAVCTRNATDAGWRLETAPPGIRWSSVAVWLAELAPEGALWVALP